MGKPKADKGIYGVVQWSDTHFPYIQETAERAVLSFSKQWSPSVHLWIGDNLDLPGISRWTISAPREQTEKRVLEGFRSFGAHVLRVNKTNPDARLVWIWGNHDDRLDQWVDKYPSWAGICDDALGLLEFYGKCPIAKKIELVKLLDFEDDFKIGKMHYAHGFSTCKHVAAKHVEEYDESITFGHSHTMQMFCTTKRGKPRSGYCIGHMISREGRKYLKGRPTRWVTGFAYLEVDVKTGEYTQHLLPIVDGKFRFAGRTYDGTKGKTYSIATNR